MFTYLHIYVILSLSHTHRFVTFDNPRAVDAIMQVYKQDRSCCATCGAVPRDNIHTYTPHTHTHAHTHNVASFGARTCVVQTSAGPPYSILYTR